MSYIGIKKIKIPAEVTLTINNNNIYFNGPLGEKKMIIDNTFEPIIDINNSYISLKNKKSLTILKGKDLKTYKSNWGTNLIIIKQNIVGVYKGFTKQLNLIGVGFRGTIEDNDILVLKLGYSHLINFKIPKNIKISCIKFRKILVFGTDIIQVTRIAAQIRLLKLPEPYKGKGILYKDEIINRKEGKKN
jgi:large subunit ribosomal protein L6